jgi:hypothetical protein
MSVFSTTLARQPDQLRFPRRYAQNAIPATIKIPASQRMDPPLEASPVVTE